MLLQVLGIERTQRAVWEDTRALVSDPNKWFTDPNALATYLSQFDAVKAKVSIDDVSIDELEAAFSRMIRVLDRQSLPSPILTYGGRHWVLFVGMEGDFLDASRETVRVGAIWVADPSRGSNGLDMYPLGDWFRSTFFTPVTIAGDWVGKLVAVTDAAATKLGAVELVESPRPLGGGTGVKLDHRDLSEILSEDIAHFTLGRSGPISQISELTIRGKARTFSLGPLDVFDMTNVSPQEVSVIQDGSVYYLLPTMMDGILAWSAISANHLGLAAVRLGSIELPATGVELEDVVRRKLHTNGSVIERAGLFWTVCTELRSLFDVVRAVSVDGIEYYVDAYDNVYDHLSTDIGG